MTANDLRETKIVDEAGRPPATGQEVRDLDRRRYRARRLGLVCAVMFAMSAKAQTQATPQAQAQTQSPSQTSTSPGDGSTEKAAGNYAVRESIEFGYRDSMIGGNLNNYGTFVNLSSGVRLFDYTLDMRSIDHQGLFFDNLSFSNSGYGGDPNDVSRLHVDKNKWYDFRATFRRDKNSWNYNLLANPLNGSKGPINGVAIGSSPHALDLSRRMQDYNLTLLPQSRFRFRLGYSRNVDTGPASTTLEGGTDTALLQSVSEISNSYRMGVDYRGLPGTTLSFDETVVHSAVNNSATDSNLIYQLLNHTPVDLGIVFVGTTPCANPITIAATAPPTVTANCNGYLSYSQFENPRSTFPTERFSFQSTYFRKLSMAGSASYSSGDNTVAGFNEAVNGWATRTLTHGNTTGGPAQAKRISVNTNWSGDYRVTDKLSIFDEFRYENWRIPSMWATADTNLFATPPQAGQTGLLLPIAMITPSTFATLCPTAPYNGPNCPQHNASSGADVTNELVSQFLGQNIRSNTIELKYEFTRRVNAYVGYEFTARTIADFSAIWDTGEIYLPGGVGGKPGILQGAAPPAAGGNYFFAARGDCAVIAATGALPAVCTYNPANGSIQEGSSTNLLPETANDTARNIYDIHENAGLIGVSARPIDTLRLNADLMFGYNDNSFTRTSPRQLQSYKLRANYTPKPWATLGVGVDIHENRDNVVTVNNIEHDRTYSLVATFSPKTSLYVDVGYSYMDIYTQTEICFPDTGSAIFTTACPIAGATSPLGTLSFYSSRDNYAYGDVMWKPHKRVTAMAGYGGSIVRGDTTFLNPLTPTGTLDFNYVKPFASLTFDIYRGLSYKTAWNYYGYNDHGVANPVGLALIPSQNFNGSNVTFVFRYSF